MDLKQTHQQALEMASQALQCGDWQRYDTAMRFVEEVRWAIEHCDSMRPAEKAPESNRAAPNSKTRKKGRNPGPGVTVHRSGRYRVNVHNPFTGKRIHGGYFDDPDEACRVAARMAEEMGAPYPMNRGER